MDRVSKSINTFRLLFLIKGILNLSAILFFLIYAIMGVVASRMIEFTEQFDPNPQAMPFNPGSVFIVVGVVGMVVCAISGTFLVIATKNWSRRTNRKFIQIAAFVNCITSVLGIILCVFTLIELSKIDMKTAFGDGPVSNDDFS